MKRKEIVIKIISLLFIALWSYAAFSKILDWEMNKRAMLMQPFPIGMANILSWLIPLLELVLVVFLLNICTRRQALLASVILLSAFSAYIGLILSSAFGSIPCACAGIFSKMGHAEHLYFNLLFILLGGVALILTHKSQERVSIKPVFSQKGGEMET